MDDAELYRLLGRNVAAHRANGKLKQAQVAEKLGLSRASLANIESGRQRVTLHHVYELVDALGLDSITDLLPARWPEASADTVGAYDKRDTLMFASESLTPVEKAQVKMVINKALMSKTGRRR
jgi:transcriptional regulator with XRE-family HTH domain